MRIRTFHLGALLGLALAGVANAQSSEPVCSPGVSHAIVYGVPHLLHAPLSATIKNVASSQIPGNADDVFAAGFQWVDDLVFARTGIRVGFTLDALPKGQTIPTPIGDRGGWVPWFSIPGQTFPGAPISAIWAPADSQHLDLFAVSGGAAITTWWDANQLAQKEFRVIVDRPYISGVSPNVAPAHLGLARALVMGGTMMPQSKSAACS